MKTFNDLKIGDKLYFIDHTFGTVSISEVKFVTNRNGALIFKLVPIIGNKENLSVFKFKFKSFCLSTFSKVFIYEEDFLEELKIRGDEKDK